MFVFQYILLMKFPTVLDTNNSTVNTELTKIKVIVRINLKWPSLDYPSFYLVGSCDHQNLYSLGGVRLPDFNIWLVITSFGAQL
jgi:hypothetical protein